MTVDVLSKSSVDAALGSNSVRSRREQFGDTSSVESSLRQTEGGAETSTTGTDDDGIVFVVLHLLDQTSSLSIIEIFTYNHSVFLGDMRGGLLCAERLVRKDPRYNPNVSPPIPGIPFRRNIPAGLVLENNRL